MKQIRISSKHIILVLAVLTVAFAAFMAGIRIAERGESATYRVNTQREGAFEVEILPDDTTAETFAIVNINAATADDLMTLDGIGPALAERIIAYRDEIGGFKYAFELMDVSGIGEKKFLAIKDKITVGE
ncbi:MAG: helix-hairpin-helix domain-containing protein [Oscillospiraceae bacterium]|nr:helix-hairpin-helix domain-containing protein [Oscillospiraceae bacterium]